MNIVFLTPAQAELQEAVDYYDSQREGLGQEFADEVEKAAERIRSFPDAWTRLSKLVRRCRTNRFPYGLVYQRKRDEIVVLAVMHLSRKPGYWKNRLK